MLWKRLYGHHRFSLTLVLYGTKFTLMLSLWNTFGNVEKLKPFGNLGTKGLISLTSRDSPGMKVASKKRCYHVFQKQIALAISSERYT